MTGDGDAEIGSCVMQTLAARRARIDDREETEDTEDEKVLSRMFTTVGGRPRSEARPPTTQSGGFPPEGVSRMLKIIYRAATAARGKSAAIAIVPILFLGAGCAAPAACVGGMGVCKSAPLAPRYAVIDPSGSQADLADRQVAEVRAIANRGPTELTVVLLGERPSTSTVVTHVTLPKVDSSDPNAVATRTALLAKLDSIVRKALAHRTNASDQFGALELVHDEAQQHGDKPGYDVFVLGDSEPCVPGVCWTRDVPGPGAAVKQVQTAYSTLTFTGESVTFVVGGDTRANDKSLSYSARLSSADLAVCRWAHAKTCKTTADVTQVTP
jgi:hypothetical protein